MSELIQQARRFASDAHAGQFRRYTGDPYIVHPLHVSLIVASVTHDEATIATALLHDVVEDTEVSINNILTEFGWEVAALVHEVTDRSVHTDGNRATRKRIDREWLAGASAAAQTVKLADLIDNSESIIEYDPSFAKVFIAEKAALLEVLQRGDSSLHDIASAIVEDFNRGA